MADTVVGLGRGTTHSYLHYRNSGVEWLGEVPEHWDVKRLKFVTSINDESLSEDEDPLRQMAYVNIGSVDSAHGIEQVEEMVFEDAPSRARRLVVNGDTIVSTVRTYLGEIAPVIEPPPHMVVSTGFAVVRPQRVDAGFISWALRERRIVEAIVARSTGVSYPAINAPEIGELFITLPPLGEQRAIGAFLDRETERIDSLVAKMRLLIERLGEYRTALITRTVTRGLPAEAARLAGVDPSPRLKPSGVEWLGRVPEHWEVKRLKFVTSINDESLSEDEDSLRPIAYVNIGSVDSALGIEQTEEMVFEDAPSRARRLVEDGDTIVSTVRTYLGEIAPVTDPRPDMVVSTGFAVIRPRKVDAGFVSWALRERRIVEAIVARSTGVSYPAINAPEIGELFVTLPPLGEQRTISAFLDRETERIDSLAEKMRLLIERLSEYRAALITEAVTGKIDVRASAESPEAHLRSRLP